METQDGIYLSNTVLLHVCFIILFQIQLTSAVGYRLLLDTGLAMFTINAWMITQGRTPGRESFSLLALN